MSILPVCADDDARTLAARVLVSEHQIYPQAVRWFAEGRLTIDGQHVRVSGPTTEPMALIVPAMESIS